MESVFENVLIGKKALALLPLAKKTVLVFFKENFQMFGGQFKK